MLMSVRSTNRMTLLDCVGLGINGIIGTGIFLLPAKVFRNAGGLSWAAWLAIGGVCLLVGLCFCEAAGRADRNGGPYLYARDAFGRWVGVGVGWMALAANLFAYGAVARGFGRNLSFLVPALNRAGPQIALAVAVIGALAALNYRGIRPGALTSDFFSGAKLIPILFFVGVGLYFVDWQGGSSRLDRWSLRSGTSPRSRWSRLGISPPWARTASCRRSSPAPARGSERRRWRSPSLRWPAPAWRPSPTSTGSPI